MGFRISWLAVQDISKENLLEALGFQDTGVSDEANEGAFSAAELNNGWTLVWSNDFEWSGAQSIQNALPTRRLIACQIHEGVMFSAVHATENGAEIWSVWHDAQKGIYDLQAAGDVPLELIGIKAKLIAEQDANGGEEADVDFIFDIPIELAEQLTGFRHDLWEVNGSRPAYTTVEKK